jgi:hypothetical protein
LARDGMRHFYVSDEMTDLRAPSAEKKVMLWQKFLRHINVSYGRQSEYKLRCRDDFLAKWSRSFLCGWFFVRYFQKNHYILCNNTYDTIRHEVNILQ